MDALLGAGPRPVNVHVKPDWSTATPMLLGWVATIAYVVAFSAVAPPTTTPAKPHLPWRDLREQQMNMYQNTSVVACADPFDHACGGYGQVEPVGPFRRAAMIVAQRVRGLPLMAECEQTVEFDNQTIEAADTLLETLVAGINVDGWAGRTSPHNGSFALHMFNVAAPSYDTRIVNPACLDDWRYTKGNRFDIVFYPTTGVNSTDAFSQACELVARWNHARDTPDILSGAPDYPTSCLEWVRQLRPVALADALRPSNTTMARLRTLAEQLRGVANVSTPIEFVGGEAGLVDEPELSPNMSVAWSEHNQRLAGLLGRPVERAVWTAAADEVNAYYDPCQNRVFVPAGILSPPFYNDEYDDELVLGGIGFVLAHELGHAVDHQCNKSALRATVAKHMATVMHLPLLAVNHTVSEDVADELGGQFVAQLGGTTSRFGLQLVQLWCGNNRNFTADPHAPGVARVNTLFTDGGALSGVFC